MGKSSSLVVQDFVHQQYHSKNGTATPFSIHFQQMFVNIPEAPNILELLVFKKPATTSRRDAPDPQQLPTWSTRHTDTVSQQKSELNLNIHMQKLMMQQLQLHKCPLMGHPDHRRHHHRRRHHQRVKGPCYDLHKSKAGVTTCTDTFGWYFKNSPYCQIHSSHAKMAMNIPNFSWLETHLQIYKRKEITWTFPSHVSSIVPRWQHFWGIQAVGLLHETLHFLFSRTMHEERSWRGLRQKPKIISLLKISMLFLNMCHQISNSVL